MKSGPAYRNSLAVELLPAVRPRPGFVALLRQRVRRRSQAQHVQEDRLAVALPPGFQKSALRLPSVRDRQTAVLRPPPVNAAVERVGKRRYLALFFRLAVEVGGGGQCPGEQERRIDGRQLGLPRTPTGLHVQEVVEESLVAGRVPCLTLRAVPQKPEHRERAFDGLGACNESAFRTDNVGSEGEPDGGDARRRPLARAVRHQPVPRVGLFQEIAECVALEFSNASSPGDSRLILDASARLLEIERETGDGRHPTPAASATSRQRVFRSSTSTRVRLRPMA